MKKLRTAIAASALLGGLMVSTTACLPEPCKGLTATEKDKQAVADGYEVERDVDGDTCELNEDGNWELDD